MAERDTTDFAAAFVIGALIGVGATLLLRPAPPTTAQRVGRTLKPYGDRVQRQARSVRKRLARSSWGADVGSEVMKAAEDLLDDFQSRIVEIVAEAGRGASRSTEEQVREARRALRRAGKKLGR